MLYILTLTQILCTTLLRFYAGLSSILLTWVHNFHIVPDLVFEICSHEIAHPARRVAVQPWQPSLSKNDVWNDTQETLIKISKLALNGW